jgi:isoleucyl-tRNA synthetase
VERLAGLIAPVLCHMAEDIWQNLPYPVAERSVFERGWPTAPGSWAARNCSSRCAASWSCADG